MTDWRLRRRDVDVALVLAVRCAQIDQVAVDHGRRVRQVVRIRSDFFQHVEAPDHVRVGLALQRLVHEGAVVLVVAESVDVETEHDATIADVVETLTFDQWGRGDTLVRPIVGATGLELRVRLLPEELAVRFAEGHQHAAVAALLWIAEQFVVGADEHHAFGDDRIAVALRAEVGDPLDVLLRLHVPLGWDVLHVRDLIAIRRSTPHRPVGRAGIGGGQANGRAQRDEREQDQQHGKARGSARIHAHKCDTKLLVLAQREVVEVRTERGIDEEPGCSLAIADRDRSCRSSTRPARCQWPPMLYLVRGPGRSADSRRGASGDTTCRASRRMAPSPFAASPAPTARASTAGSCRTARASSAAP